MLYNPIRKFIAKREEHYRKLDEEANAKLASAQKYDAEAKARFESADNEIREKRMEAETKLNNYIAAQMKEADAKAEKLVADAKKSRAGTEAGNSGQRQEGHPPPDQRGGD